MPCNVHGKSSRHAGNHEILSKIFRLHKSENPLTFAGIVHRWICPASPTVSTTSALVVLSLEQSVDNHRQTWTVELTHGPHKYISDNETFSTHLLHVIEICQDK